LLFTQLRPEIGERVIALREVGVDAPQRSRELTHFCSWKRTQQVRMSLWSGGLIGR
jgi:hypothetical protein